MKKVVIVVILLFAITVLCFGRGKKEKARERVSITQLSFDFNPKPTELEGEWRNIGKNNEGTFEIIYSFAGNGFSCTERFTKNNQTEENVYSGTFGFFNEQIIFNMDELNGESNSERWSQKYTFSDFFFILGRDSGNHFYGHFFNHDLLDEYDFTPTVFEGSWISLGENNEGTWQTTYTFTGNKFSFIDIRVSNNQKTEYSYSGFFTFGETSITFKLLESNGSSFFDKWTQRYVLTGENIELIRVSNKIGGKFQKQ